MSVQEVTQIPISSGERRPRWGIGALAAGALTAGGFADAVPAVAFDTPIVLSGLDGTELTRDLGADVMTDGTTA
ncbi:MAG: hypothetical protein JJE50_05200 [Actinomycetales bacterium]|nr:hypothetical protein [Actinomycetales bacterium]